MGSVFFWDPQRVDNPVWLVKSAKQKLEDLFINEWFLNISNSSTSLNNRLFKEKFELEYYMLKLPYTMKRSLSLSNQKSQALNRNGKMDTFRNFRKEMQFLHARSRRRISCIVALSYFQCPQKKIYQAIFYCKSEHY